MTAGNAYGLMTAGIDAVAWRHYLRPPGRPSWDSMITSERAICYDGDAKVVRL